MIEYLYDAVKATSGENITIVARITDENGLAVTGSCKLELFNDEKFITKVYGIYADELWSFTIPADATTGLYGRYWYSISARDSSLSFKEPIYLS